MKPFDTLLGVVIEPLVVEPRADVAVVAGDKPARVQAAADFDDVGANLFFSPSTQSRQLSLTHATEGRRHGEGLSWSRFLGVERFTLRVSVTPWLVIVIDTRRGISPSRSSSCHRRSPGRATRRCRTPDRARASPRAVRPVAVVRRAPAETVIRLPSTATRREGPAAGR